jgi:hypothetical protein
MTMPETPVYENYLLPAAKNKIRTAWQILLVEPIAIALCKQ